MGGLPLVPRALIILKAFRNWKMRVEITRIRWAFGVGFVFLLLGAGVGVAGAGHDAPLADAVERGDQQAVASLLKNGADVNAAQSDGATALHWAAYLNDAGTT